MAKAAAISFKEFRTRYHAEESCREELLRQRCQSGFGQSTSASLISVVFRPCSSGECRESPAIPPGIYESRAAGLWGKEADMIKFPAL